MLQRTMTFISSIRQMVSFMWNDVVLVGGRRWMNCFTNVFRLRLFIYRSIKWRIPPSMTRSFCFTFEFSFYWNYFPAKRSNVRGVLWGILTELTFLGYLIVESKVYTVIHIFRRESWVDHSKKTLFRLLHSCGHWIRDTGDSVGNFWFQRNS